MQHHCKGKNCNIILSSASELFDHFQSNHKYLSTCTFACGKKSCSIRFASLKRYNSHILEFHSTSTSTQDVNKEFSELVRRSGDDNGLLKCAYPGCTYTSRKRVTLRSHRFRKHGGSGEPPVESSDDGNVQVTEHNIPIQIDENLEIVQNESQDTVMLLAANNPEILSPIQFKEIVEKFVDLYRTLNSKHHVPQSTLQNIVETYRVLLRLSNTSMLYEISRSLSQAGLPQYDQVQAIVDHEISKSAATFVHSEKGPLRSTYMRTKNFKAPATFVPPESHYLGLNDNNKKRYYHTVPVKKSLKAFFEDDSVYEQVQEKKLTESYSGCLRDIYNGSLYQSLSEISDPSCIFLMLYSDDLELCNPIGCAKTVHKITNIYISVANLLPWSRTKSQCLMLVLTCREKDISYFGLPKVLEPLILELQSLESTGMEIRGNVRKVKVLSLLGDSLGTHTISGFLESFGKTLYFCRYCEESRAQWKGRWYHNDNVPDSDDESCEDNDSDDDDDDDDGDEDDNFANYCGNVHFSENIEDDVAIVAVDELCDESANLLNIPIIPALRTEQSYNNCLRMLERSPSLSSVKGVVADCQFNKLESFHCIGRSPPCVPHDIFEGIIPNDLKLALVYLSDKFKFTSEFLNRKICSFPLLGLDKLDRPPKISETKMKISGNAVQNWVLLRFLPLFIGEKVTDKNDKVWLMILLLRRIVEMICSPVIQKSSLPKLATMIRMYLYLRCRLFPHIPLRPKHHFLEHYATLIEIFGPLMRVSTLAFETKHVFFKETLRSKKCTKNVTKTMADEHQLMITSIAAKNLVENFPVFDTCTLLRNSILAPELVNRIGSYFGQTLLETLALSEKVDFRGTEYAKGLVVVLSSRTRHHLRLCHIETICVRGSECYAAGYCFLSLFYFQYVGDRKVEISNF